VFRTSTGARLAIGPPPRHRRLWPEGAGVDHVERRVGFWQVLPVALAVVSRRHGRNHLGDLAGGAQIPRTITTSSPLTRCTTTRRSVARSRALTVRRSLYRHRVPPVTTPHTGAACGAPEGVVVHSQQLRADARRAATSAQDRVLSGTRT
jgi:hypothetical protein